MGLIDNIKGMFSASTPKAESYPEEDYKGYTIQATPLEEGGQYRVSGIVSKGEKSQPFIRADVLGSSEECAKETVRKAKLTIDQIGDEILDNGS